MKKKLALLLTTMLAVSALSGCGNESSNAEALKDMKVEKYVTLGEYKGLEVSVEEAAPVEEGEWDSLVNQIYFSAVTAENGGIVDRPVEEGDTANIDYVGKKDDVAFEGGTASGQNLTIGSGQFIEGFEEGLVGVMPGETVDLNLKFPENYERNEELSGADVVFTVTVNYIQPTDLKDEVVAGFEVEDFKNVAELRQYVHDYLSENAKQSYEANVENAVLGAFLQTCTFKDMPKNLVTNYGNSIRENLEAAAASMGVDADTYTNYYFGASLEDFISTSSVESAQQGVAFQTVANAENLNITDEELDTMLTEFATGAGYTTLEEFIGENPKEDYREFFMFEKVMDYLVENANIK